MALLKGDKMRFALSALLVSSCGSAQAQAPAAEVGKPAPDFALKDTGGKPVSLASFRGKTVVLEWFNPDCPFVKHAHGQGALKSMAGQQTKRGIVWLAINSGASGKQGHGVDRNAEARKQYALDHPVLIDEDGKVGRAYGAKTTPHMFVIDAKGTLVYAGAIDNAPMGEAAGPPVNYVEKALEALGAGKKIDPAQTKSWGCSVKYGP
jgi:peroxiredoxin